MADQIEENQEATAEQTTAQETPSAESTDSTSSGGGSMNSTVSKVPITDPVEAMSFAKTEWNKIRRTSGHTLECQVFGSNHWKTGEWCKIYIPSLNEYVDMYISKVDHSNDSGSEWLTSITLMDYAPQLSSVDESELKDASGSATGEQGTGNGESSETSIWTQVASILQTYYEKPDASKSDGGWNDKIRAIVDAKVYDPDIRSVITGLTKKKGQELKSYVDVGHDLCNVKGIDY